MENHRTAFPHLAAYSPYSHRIAPMIVMTSATSARNALRRFLTEPPPFYSKYPTDAGF